MNYQAVPVQGGIGVYIPAEYVTGNVEISAKAEAHFGGTYNLYRFGCLHKDADNPMVRLILITTPALSFGCRQKLLHINRYITAVRPKWAQKKAITGKTGNARYAGTRVATGGTATCSQLAICTICESQYGELDPDNHKPVSEWTQESGKHYHKCEYGCDTHLDETNCFGGEATCTEKAVCEICFNPYGKSMLPTTPTL